MDSGNLPILHHSMQGFLRRAGKTGKSLGLRRKRFYKLDGAIFSKHPSEESEASWHVNIQGSEIVKLGKHHFVLVLKNAEADLTANDFEDNTIILYAKTEEECQSWTASLRYAADRKLENHYEIGPLIGEGGFAKVRLGKCAATGELRAVKTMKKSEAHAKLFGTEVAIIKRVSHPNIVKTYDVYETSSEIHIVMEYMEGGMLYDAIEDGVRFKEADTAQFMRELLDGMVYLHRQGIVHRDMKPENVLCTSKKPPLHVKIADFGLSSITSLAELKTNRILMSTMIGTPEFIAPEIAKKQEYTEKVDVWALGMLCYNVISGNLPLDETRDMIPQIRDGLSLTFAEPEWKTYSDQARSFVKALLCTAPEKRLSPMAGLVHPWLEGQKSKESKNVGAHGRVSKFLLRQGDHIHIMPSKGSTHPKSVKKWSTPEEAKKKWVVAYLAVSASNRFNWLVHPERYDKAMVYPRSSALTSPRSQESGSQRESLISQISAFQDLHLMREESGTDDECNSLNFSSLTKHLNQISLTEKGSNGGQLKQVSSQGLKAPQQRGAIRSLEENGITKYPPSDLEPSASPLRKPTLKSKMLAALSGETANRLAPVRKLSRKLAKRNEAKKSNTPSLIGQSQLNLNMSLDEINAVQVDDSDALRLEDSELSGPASMFGKKHRLLIAKHHLKDEMSPITPHKE